MDQKRIGKLIAECRKEKKLTQTKLADMLGVTDKSVSKWENGICLPDVSLYKNLCQILGITLNEFFAGERISDDDYKKVSDENLYNALENSTFTLKDKIDYFKKKWKKDHLLNIVLSFVSWLVVLIALKLQDVEIYLIGTISGLLAMLFYIILYNKMMVYIEKNAYGNNCVLSNQEFKNYIQRLDEVKKLMNQFNSKDEAVSYLVKETKLSKKECSDAYDFIIKLDLDKIKK